MPRRLRQSHGSKPWCRRLYRQRRVILRGFLGSPRGNGPGAGLGLKDVLNRLLKVVAAALVATSGLLATSAPDSSAATSATSTGFDISFPQCDSPFPAGAGFGIVGVNDGHPESVNPCVASELGWAQASTNPNASFYMNTDSPGPADTSNWPTDQQSPDVCTGANSLACSYDYGWNAAASSFATAVSAETATGSVTPTSAATEAKWWLDVETDNHWEAFEGQYGATATSRDIDQEMLLGAIAYLKGVGVDQLGIYSTTRQWTAITGAPSGFSALPAWLPGYGSLAAAQAACTTPSFNGGRVAMIQYPSRGLDGDYVCGLLSAPTSASVTDSGSLGFSQQLNVTGESQAVTYVQTSGSPALTVSPTGLVTTSGTLAAGLYTAAGTSSDATGNTGSFSFTLSVGAMKQVAPTSTSVTVAGAATFADQLSVTGSAGPASFVQTSGSPDLTVSPTGLLTTDGTLTPGTYSATGTTGDASGDAGTFHFTLYVGTITQGGVTTASVDVPAAATFTTQLTLVGSAGTATFVQTSGSPDLTVSPTGLLATDGTLAVGSYVARGTTSDTSGDKGTFFYDLKVTALVVPPPPPALVATRVIGHAVAGRTVSLTIVGTGFNGRPQVTSHSGTTALVTHDSGTSLTLRVAVTARSRNGTFTFTIALASGATCHVKYQQR